MGTYSCGCTLEFQQFLAINVSNDVQRRIVPYHASPIMNSRRYEVACYRHPSCSGMEMVAHIIRICKQPPNSLPVQFTLSFTLCTGKEFPGWVIIKSATCVWFVIRLACWCDAKFQHCISSNYIILYYTPSIRNSLWKHHKIHQCL